MLWACLLGGWLGFGVCATARVRVGVCVLWCWRFGGVVGQCGPAAPFAPLACLRAHAFGVGLLACAGCCVPDGRRAALLGRDNRVPPHTAWRGLLRSPRGAEERGVACGVIPVC